MYVYSCKHQLEDILTCIYDAWNSEYGYKNIRLVFEPIIQYSVFEDYIHVNSDMEKADKVMQAIKNKISPYVYRRVAFASMAYEEDIMDVIYHVLILGFALGPEVLNMTAYRDVMRFNEICTRLEREVCRFKEFSRFHDAGKGLYVAHIEPKSRLVAALGPVFEDRMPSEHFIIVDDVHKEAVIHPADQDWFVKILTDSEYERLLQTEKINDSYTDLWQVFFDTVAIQERISDKRQKNLFPIWTRKHAVEFMNKNN